MTDMAIRNQKSVIMGIMSKTKQILNKISQTAGTKAYYEYLVRSLGLLTSFPHHPYIGKDEATHILLSPSKPLETVMSNKSL